MTVMLISCKCAILAVLWAGLLATAAEQSEGRMLLPGVSHRNCCPGLVYAFSPRSCGTLTCSVCLFLLSMCFLLDR